MLGTGGDMSGMTSMQDERNLDIEMPELIAAPLPSSDVVVAETSESEPDGGAVTSRKLTAHETLLENYDFDVANNDTASIMTGADTMMDETKKQLEDLEIRTVYTLVEDIEIDVNGQTQKKKLLYVTNKQARMFLQGDDDRRGPKSDREAGEMDKFMNAFDINPKPKLVINLYPSFATFKFFRPFGQHWRTMENSVGFGDHHFHSEVSDDALRMTDRKLAMFLRNQILPIARENNALVLIHNDSCSMAYAFGRICEEEGGKGPLPFTVLTMCWGHVLPTHPDSIASLVMNQSKRWKDARNGIQEAILNTYGAERSQHSSGPTCQGDIPRGCTHIIVVEGVTRRKCDSSALLSFKNQFAEQLQKQGLPSIALSTMALDDHFEDTFRTKFLSDHVNRGLPLMLIDTQPQGELLDTPEMKTVDEVLQWEEQRLKELNGAGTGNYYMASRLAMWHRILTRNRELLLLKQEAASDKDGPGGKRLLWEEIERKELRDDFLKDRAMQLLKNKGQAEAKRNKSRKLTKARSGGVDAQIEDLDFVEHALECIKNVNLSNVKFGIARKDRKLQKLIQAVQDAESVDQLSSLLTSVSQAWQMEQPELDYHHACKLFLNSPTGHFSRKEIVKGGVPWTTALAISPATAEQTGLPAVKDETIRILSSLLGTAKDLFGYSCKYDDPDGEGGELAAEVYMALHNLLINENVYSGHLDEPEGMVKQINQIAKIDRLPSANETTGLRVVRQCWDNVDIFNAHANVQKMITKVSYVLLLLSGYGVTLVSVLYMHGLVNSNPDEKIIDDKMLQFIMIILSLFSSILAAIVTFANPSQKWQQLRGAALTIEAEVWKFRTRTGPYAISTSSTHIDKRAGEDHLRETCAALTKHVLKSAAISETRFASSFLLFEGTGHKESAKKFHHGQHRFAGVRGSFGNSNVGKATEDDHHSPLNPDDYLKLRVQPMVQFYQSRLPVYHRGRWGAEVFIVAAGLSGTLLAFLNVAHWTPAMAAAATIVGGYLEFQGTSKKMARYNDTVLQLLESVTWWNSLSAVDKANLNNINGLVQSCESLFRDERQSWLSTSMVTKMLNKTAASSHGQDKKGRGSGTCDDMV